MANAALQSRREILKGVIVGFLVGLSGCQLGSRTETVSIPIFNNDQTSHEVSASLQFQEETLLEQTVHVEADGEVELSFENPDDGGDATLTVTITDGETLEEPVAVGPGSGLESIQITIDDDGSVSVAVGVR
jgi:hypothetical protein